VVDRRLIRARRPSARAVTLLAMLVLLATGAPSAWTQPSARAYRIGWLAPAVNPDNLEALRDGLRALGYTEDTQVVIDPRYPGSVPAQLAKAAAELVGTRPDVIVTDGSAASLAVKRTTATVPVVFVSGDPVGSGLVPNLSRPGGNLTGFAVVGTELNVKRLELLREALPRLARVGVVYESWQERRMVPPLEAQARARGLPVTRLPVRGAEELEEAFRTAVRERVGAVMPIASALFHAERQKLVALAARHRLPTMYENHAFADAGGLMSYGPDVQEIFRRVAAHVDRILKGAKPADLPIEQPTTFGLVVNLEAAQALGVTLPRALLLRADRVIDGRR
jgi:putative ABC transport system substrate-binding protein